MRILSEHSLANGYKASIFSWNGKYILKIENGFLEQTYKVSETEITSVKELENLLLSQKFTMAAKDVFDRMDQNLAALFDS